MKIEDLLKIEGFEELGEPIKELNEKLGSNDIELLINDKSKGEFIPRDRIKTTKKEAELLEKELTDLKEKTKGFEKTQKELNSFKEKYENLNKEVTDNKVNSILESIEGLKDIELFKMLAGEDKLVLNEDGEIEDLESIVEDIKNKKGLLFDDVEEGNKKEEDENLDNGGVVNEGSVEKEQSGDFIKELMKNAGDGKLEFTV